MKTWIRRTLIATVATGLLAGTAFAFAQHRMHHHGGWSTSEADVTQMRDKFIVKATKELKLDAAQQAKLGVLADALQAQRRALKAGSADDPRAELQALMAGNTFDRSRAQALVTAKTSAVQTQAPAVVAAMGDFFDSLQPAQQAQVRGFLAARGGWRHGHGERHGEGPRSHEHGGGEHG